MAVLQLLLQSKFAVSGLGMHNVVNRQFSHVHEPTQTLERIGVAITCGMP